MYIVPTKEEGMRGGKEEGNSMVIYALCTGGCAEEAEVCVQVCVQVYV